MTRPTIPGELLRYLAASLCALMFDLAVLHVAASVVHYLLAATLSYCAGAVLLYLLAVRFVFHHRRLGTQGATEFTLFTSIGLGGLVVNDMVIWLAVEHGNATLLTAKLGAAGASFLFNFAFRKQLLFR